MRLSTRLASGQTRLRRIGCIGFDWRAEVSLRETLALLGGRTIDRWQYTEEPLADVLVYDSSNALAQAVVRRRQAEDGNCICLSSDGTDSDALTLRYPFGASRLIRCLDHASRSLAIGGHANAASDGDSLCQRLDKLLAATPNQAIVLRAGNREGLLWAASGRVAWPVTLDLDEIASLLGSEVQMHPAGRGGQDELDTIRAQASCEQSAESLLWAIGITRSGGQLLRRLDARQTYRLRRWPDFGAIGRRSADLRCTSLLMQRALTLDELSRLAALPTTVIVPFLNAAALCGLLAGDAATRTPVRTGSGAVSRFGGVLQRIRNAFSLHDVR